MGQVNTEQAVRIFESGANSVRDTVVATTPEAEPTNYWWLLALAVVPVIIGAVLTWWLKRKK